ncbi:hydrolase [Sphaerisporangium krabiense]|uniref:Putative hydrolase of the HAD superfamily n=1 Tax=Sphaerisporangium krabiense TaxID=763782 RepID=A0A7W8Z354_9ACTN|nr:HAD family hydrolase [Sphaerisporangium krabiense]MBB5626598.1 putative hydrolase of the HAD superfamily [Sphaerisporangium krabiense]GII63519.1 hydrolase [Sphaerisporangium krabiense]
MKPFVQALLFDLDGTLLDHDAAAAAALAETLAEVPGVDLGRAGRRWAELERHAMDRYLAGELTFTAQRRLRVVSLAAELGLGAWDDAEADAWFAEYLGHYEAAWRLFPDVRPALDALAEQRPDLLLGVLTNGDAAQQRRKLEAVGLARDLPELIVSSEAGAAKPDPLIFERARERMGLPAGRIAYVGDRLQVDAIPAARAGMHGIWLNRSGVTGRPPRIPAIQTLHDVPALLASLDGAARRSS